MYAGLVDLFHRIDANSDGSLEWEEFNTYLIEGGLLFSVEAYADVLEFEPARVVDTTRHNPRGVARVFHFSSASTTTDSTMDDFLFVVDQERKFKMYNPQTSEQVLELKSPSVRGAVLGVDYIPQDKLLVSTHSEGRLVVWDAVLCHAISTVPVGLPQTVEARVP